MRNSFVIAVLAIGVVIGFAGASALQEGTMPKGDEGHDDSMEAPAPLDDPVTDQMVGKWKWEGKMWHEGQEIPLVAEEMINWALNKQWVMHGYKSYKPDGSVAYEAFGVSRPDPSTGKTKLYWFDNHGDMTTWDGQRTEMGEEASTEASFGKMKMTIAINEDGTVNHKMWMMPKGVEEWMPMMDAKGTKEGSKGSVGKVGKMPGGKGVGRGKGGMGGGK